MTTHERRRHHPKSRASGIISAVQAMRKAQHLGLIDGAILAIGNAPTALTFLGYDARLMARNIFLDGNTWKDSHRVDKRPFVHDIALGAAYNHKNYRTEAAPPPVRPSSGPNEASTGGSDTPDRRADGRTPRPRA